MTQALTGKTALVTGASRGLGRAAARRLAGDGAHVLVHYGRSQAEADSLVAEIEAAGGSAEAIAGDLAETSAVEDLAARVTTTLGARKLDILVNNAGIVEHDTTAATLDKLYAVNIRAPFVLTTALEPVIADGGSIVFVTTSVTQFHFPTVMAYAASKGAIDVLIRYLAAEYGPRGIRVNGVAPGAIATDMNPWLDTDEGKANVNAFQALQRVGQPDDVARVIAFLAGPDSGWVTGDIVTASGGSKL